MQNKNPTQLTFVIATALLVLMAGYVFRHTLFHSNALTDNLYNKGVILRSASATAQHWLETSYLHWYFEETAIVRAEDWHRSLSLIIQRSVARLFPESDEWVIRLPHLFWTVLWLGASAGLYLRLNQARFPALSIWQALGIPATLGLLVFNKWSLEILSGAFMDDIPGAAFVLLGLIPLLMRQPSYKQVGISALMFGLAFLAKDMNLLWGAVGFILITISLWSPSNLGQPGKFARRLFVYTIILALIYGVKLTWNLHDLKTPLPTAARVALNARLIAEDDGEHDLYIFKGTQVPGYFEIARGVGWSKIIMKGAKQLLYMALDQIYTFSLLLFGAALWIIERNRPILNRFLGFTLLVSGVYTLFFLLQLGEAAQTRYWLAPFSMMVVVFTAFMTPNSNLKRPVPLPVCAIKLIMILAISLFSYRLIPGILQEQELVYAHNRPYSARVYEVVSEKIGHDETVLAHTNQGVFIWSEFPQIKVVAVKPYHLATLDEDGLAQMITKYGISLVIFSKDDVKATMFDLLEQSGFSVLQDTGAEVIFSTTKKGSHAWPTTLHP